jgi:hypothetical protein
VILATLFNITLANIVTIHSIAYDLISDELSGTGNEAPPSACLHPLPPQTDIDCNISSLYPLNIQQCLEPDERNPLFGTNCIIN